MPSDNQYGPQCQTTDIAPQMVFYLTVSKENSRQNHRHVRAAIRLLRWASIDLYHVSIRISIMSTHACQGTTWVYSPLSV